MDKTLESFDYDLLLERLSSYAYTPRAKEALLSIRPTLTQEEAEKRFELTEDVLALRAEGRNPPLCNIDTFFVHLGKLRVEGAYLLPEELLEVREGLSILSDTSLYLSSVESPTLKEHVGYIADFRELTTLIDKTITPSGLVKDGASKKLLEIRRELSYIRDKIISKLESFFPQEKSYDAIRDEFVTIRNGRFVIPVKSERGGIIKGIIHDRSKTGKTYYVEPFEVIELNNKYRELLKDEEEEVVRILLEVSQRIRERLGEIEDALNAYYRLDFAWALGEFAHTISGSRPIFSNDVVFELKDSYNPLLFLSKGKDTVPFTLVVGKDKKGVIVSGPNGGGKTVFLKALGLIAAMAKSGLFVPGKEPKIYPFRDIFSYISDEQDISSSLSTYTAFLSRIKELFKKELSDLLVIIDELGEGTDVEEGSALGIAILDELRKKGAFFVVSTHQMPIKSYGEENEDIETLSFLFDEKERKPTFKLFPGIPGSSRALDVALSIGLPAELIEKARSFVPELYRKGERLLARLEEKVAAVQRVEDSLKKVLKEAERLLGLIKKLYIEAKRTRERVRKEAYEEIRPIIREAKKVLKEARKAKVEEVREKIRKVEREADAIAPSLFEEKDGYIPKVGDTVELSGFKRSFTVVGVDEEKKKAKVESGSLRMEVPFSMLTRAKEAQFNKGEKLLVDAERSGGNTIKVIGKTREDAIIDVERFLDKALLSGWKEIKVIHGIGTGRLREGIWEYFSKHPLVKRIKRDENPGVTVIEVIGS